MTTTTQDDLLIIQDDTEVSGEDFSFNFDFDSSIKEEGSIKLNQDKTWDINSDLEERIMIAEEEWITPEKILPEQTDALELDTEAKINIEIGEIWDDVAKVDKEENQDNLSDMNYITSEPISKNDSIDNELQQTDKNDLNSILNETITKLQSRKKTIWDTTEDKKKKATELWLQIKSLESQVSQIESEIASLWQESEKIDANISQLESMKLNPIKEHNSRRSVKK